jgi:hypothetical protein
MICADEPASPVLPEMVQALLPERFQVAEPVAHQPDYDADERDVDKRSQMAQYVLNRQPCSVFLVHLF